MKIREIINAWKVPFNKGPESDDAVLTNMFVYHLMKVTRAILLYERLRDPLFNYQWALQTLDCIKLIPTEKNECTEKLPSGCKWLKSEKPIPQSINDIIVEVYNDRGDNYTRVFSESSKSFKRYQFGKENSYKYIIKNNHLYVPNLNSPKWVKVRAPFYSEEDVLGLCDCNCNFLDADFHIDTRLIKKLKDIMYDEVLKIYPYMKRDIINNANLEDAEGRK